jgi:hypothetical protein
MRRLMEMDRDREKQERREKLAKCRRLANEYNDGETAKYLNDFATELNRNFARWKLSRVASIDRSVPVVFGLVGCLELAPNVLGNVAYLGLHIGLGDL